MKFIDYKVYTGFENMQIDSDLLESAIKNQSKEPILRLYGWSPACISLGRNQNDSFVDQHLIKDMGIDIVRRHTGGRALLHDNELTYSYISPASIIPNGENISQSYEYISGIWINIFKDLNISLTIGGLPRHITHNNYCMAISTGADLCWRNKKLIGSAQCRKNGYILQHGSILLDYKKELLDKIFNEHTDYSTITTLKEINSDITLEKLLFTIKNHFNCKL